MTRSFIVPLGAVVASLGLLAAQGAAGYEHSLDDRSVREAYFLGRTTDTEKLKKFLGQYVRRFPVPVKGPHVAEIEFRTPYEQVVLRSSQKSVGYSAQQAQKDYAEQPDLVVVRVLIHLTPTYAGFITNPSYGKGQAVERPEDFWQEFQFRVGQDHTIAPKRMSGRPGYNSGTRGPYRVVGALQGAEVPLEFSAQQFSSRTARVEVIPPEGRTVEAEFDLALLK